MKCKMVCFKNCIENPTIKMLLDTILNSKAVALQFKITRRDGLALTLTVVQLIIVRQFE